MVLCRARRSQRRAVALGMAAAVLASGCGGEGSADPTRAVPEGAALYVDFDADPSGAQERRLGDISERLPGRGSGSERLTRLLNRALSLTGLDISVDDEIRPWIGKRAGFFVSRVSRQGEIRDAALVLSTADSSKAQESIQNTLGDRARKRSHSGVAYRVAPKLAGGIVDGLAVVGTESAVKASISASKRRSLADSSAYKRSVARLPDEWLAAAFSGSPNTLKRAGLAGLDIDGLVAALTERTLTTLRLARAGMVLESELGKDAGLLSGLVLGGAGTRLVGQLPADSWAAVGQPALGANVRRLLSSPRASQDAQGIVGILRRQAGVDVKRDLLSWMGDAAVFANGLPHNPFNAGLVVATKHPDASTRAIDRLARAIRAGGVLSVRPIKAEFGPGRGYVFSGQGLPTPIELFGDKRRVVIAGAIGLADVAAFPGTTLRDREEFQTVFRRLGRGFQPSTFLIMEKALPTLEFLRIADGPRYRRAKPYLQVLDRIVGGTKPAGRDGVASRTLITIK